MYEKLEDRYEQEKFLSVFKYYVNDINVIRRVADYYCNMNGYDVNVNASHVNMNASHVNVNVSDINGLVPLLTQLLKFDKLNFIKHKSQLPSTSPFGGRSDHFGHNSSTSHK